MPPKCIYPTGTICSSSQKKMRKQEPDTDEKIQCYVLCTPNTRLTCKIQHCMGMTLDSTSTNRDYDDISATTHTSRSKLSTKQLQQYESQLVSAVTDRACNHHQRAKSEEGKHGVAVGSSQ